MSQFSSTSKQNKAHIFEYVLRYSSENVLAKIARKDVWNKLARPLAEVHIQKNGGGGGGAYVLGPTFIVFVFDHKMITSFRF